MIKEFIIKRKIFIKYIFSAGLSFFIDLLLFKIFSMVLDIFIVKDISLILATIFARICSSICNYLINKNRVFNNKSSQRKIIEYSTFIKYYILVFIQMIISGLGVTILYNIIKIDEIFIKVFVDIIIFIINYFIQKKFIFNKT